MNITNILLEQSSRRPLSPAIIDRNGLLTFAELETRSGRAASLLKEAGLNSGDAVLVFYPMSAELYVILIALFRLGLVPMFLDPSAGRDHIERCCALHRPKAMIASAKAHLLRIISPALRRIPIKFSVGVRVPGAINWSRIQNAKYYKKIFPVESDTPALITFTSGSTAAPKAAVRSHGFLIAQHRVLAESLKMKAGESDLTTLPIFVLANLASGVTSILPDADMRRPGDINAESVVAQINERKPQSTAASPAFLERIVDYCEQTGERLDGFERIFTGGAPVFPRLLNRLQRVAPHATVTAVYGSTEAEPIAEISLRDISGDDLHAQLNGRGLLAGHAVEQINLRIMRDRRNKSVGPYTSEDFEAACLPAGEIGEIVVAGEHVLKGYLGGEGDAETKIKVGKEVWHRTGDAGYIDSSGRLWLMGRCSARIVDERASLYPFAVECAASEIKNVRRAAVVAHRGRRPLVLELCGSINDAELAFIREKLHWAKLDEIRIYKRLPVDRRHNAKIDYTSLQALLDTVPVHSVSLSHI
jgi:acyl-CoA synthetase (AMP-forming)/AMP-acid ligase II